MRTLVATVLALLLILIGVGIVGLASVRIFQESGFLRMDIDTAGADAASAESAAAAAALRTDLLDSQAQPQLSGVESGGMALGASGGQPALAAPADAAPVVLPITPTVTIDPCPPAAEPGWPADASVAAIGMVRLYDRPDLASQPLGEFGAGQMFLVTADPAAVTAVRRCDLVWVRVRLTGGVMGWVLGGAILIAPPTAVPTLPPICPGGCATPVYPTPCCNPCPQPCAQPCNQPCTQPCTTPCGVYSQ